MSPFGERKAIIDRVHARLGLPAYSHRQYVEDEKALRANVARKRRLRREEAERIAMFDGELVRETA